MYKITEISYNLWEYKYEKDLVNSSKNFGVVCNNSHLTFEERCDITNDKFNIMIEYLKPIAISFKETFKKDCYFAFKGMNNNVSIIRNDQEFVVEFSSQSAVKKQRHVFPRKIIIEKDFLEITRNLLIVNGYACKYSIQDSFFEKTVKSKVFIIKENNSLIEINLECNEVDFAGYHKKDKSMNIKLQSGNTHDLFNFIKMF